MALLIYTHFTSPEYIKLILEFYLNLKIFLVKRLVILIYFTVEIIIIQFEVFKISNSKAGHTKLKALRPGIPDVKEYMDRPGRSSIHYGPKQKKKYTSIRNSRPVKLDGKGFLSPDKRFGQGSLYIPRFSD